MRLIPKKSKINSTIWKSLTLFDVILAFLLISIIFLIILSNLKYKLVIVFIIAAISVVLFFPSDDKRAYYDIVYLIKYIISPKTFIREHKNKKKNINSITPQEGLEERGIINYGTYFAGVLSVGSVEFRLLNEWSQNTKISHFADLLNSLNSDQSMQLVKIDRPINFDEISLKIFEKVKSAEKEVPIDYAKIAILKSRLSQIDGINNVQKQYRPFYYIVIYDKDKQNLNQTLDYFIDAFHGLELGAKRLDKKELAVFLKYCYTRNFDEREIESAHEDEYLNFVKPQSVKFKPRSCQIDDTYSFTFSLSDYPLNVFNAWGDGLFNIDNTKVVLNIKPVVQEKAVKRIDKVITEVNSREVSGKASEYISQATHVETMGELLQSLQNGNESLFDCTLTITGFNNDKAENAAFRKLIYRQITQYKFKISNLRYRQFDGFISSSITRRNSLSSFERGINSESLAAVFPFVFTSIIESDGLTLGQNNYPVIMDFWKWKINENYQNANMFAVGKPGSGKSYFVKTLLELGYSDDFVIFMLDPENEYNTLCRNLGGTFIDVGNAIMGRINPFHIYQILTDDGNTAPTDVVFWSHLRTLESFFIVTLPGITSDSLEELNNLIVQCYLSRGITENTDCRKLKATDFPIFDDLMRVVKEALALEQSQMRKMNLQRVETYIAKFASGGRNSNLWNGASTLKADSKFTVFNFQSLFESKNTTVANGQMLMIMRYLEQQIINVREKNRNSNKVIHTFIGIDEGYNFTDSNNPVALDFIYIWYKRIRKYDGMMAFLTQNLSDLLGNAEIVSKTSAIINNSQYSFVFGLSPQDISILVDIYRGNGEINETEQNEIVNAKTGQCFLVSSISNRTSYKVIASDVVETMFSEELSSDQIKFLAGAEELLL